MTAPTHPPFPLASPPQSSAVSRAGEPEVRIGDAERSEACELLNRHFAAGRLTHPELAERLDGAVSARTVSDLRGLFGDLPRLPRPVAATASGPRPRPRSEVATTFLAISGLLAIPVVCLMLLGSMFLGPGIFLFSLIGGSLAAVSGAALARLAGQGPPPRRP